MITADKLKTLTTMTPRALTQVVQASGYKRDRVNECRFLGITNGGQFCYKIVYPDQDAKNGMATTKVYVWEDHNGELLADY